MWSKMIRTKNGHTLIRRLVVKPCQAEMSRHWENAQAVPHQLIVKYFPLTSAVTYSKCLLMNSGKHWDMQIYRSHLPSSVCVCVSTNPLWSIRVRDTSGDTDAEAKFPYLFSFFLINLSQTIFKMQKFKLEHYGLLFVPLHKEYEFGKSSCALWGKNISASSYLYAADKNQDVPDCCEN